MTKGPPSGWYRCHQDLTKRVSPCPTSGSCSWGSAQSLPGFHGGLWRGVRAWGNQPGTPPPQWPLTIPSSGKHPNTHSRCGCCHGQGPASPPGVSLKRGGPGHWAGTSGQAPRSSPSPSPQTCSNPHAGTCSQAMGPPTHHVVAGSNLQGAQPCLQPAVSPRLWAGQTHTLLEPGTAPPSWAA